MDRCETGAISVWLVGAVFVLSTVLVYRHIKAFSYWSSRGIKGPTPWPFVGTQIYYMFRHKINVDREWRNKYGHTYGVYDGYAPVLQTSDNELIKHICIKNFSSFTDRDNSSIFCDNMRRWLFWSKGEHWANQRALVTPLFTSSMMKGFFRTMSGCVDRFLSEVNARIADSSKDANKSDGGNKKEQQQQAIVFSKDELMSLTLDVIASSFFSIKLDTYKDKESDFAKRAFAFAHFDVVRFVWWMMIPMPVSRYFKIDLISPQKYKYFEKLSQATIDERRKNPAANKAKNDLVQALLNARIPDHEKQGTVYTEQDDLEAHYNDSIKHHELQRHHERQSKAARKFRSFDDAEIRAHMTFFFLAGFEAMGWSLVFCIYTLAHEQDAQEQVLQELVASYRQRSGKLDDQLVGYSDLLSLKKLDAFVSETLRLYNPIVEHERIVTADEGVVLPTSRPLKLPQGSVVGIEGFVLHRDEDYWERPLEFDLSRFYPENRHKIKPCTYNPFGLGPRNCVGMRFALLEIKLCLAKLLLRYRVLPGPNTAIYPPEFKRHAFFTQFKHTDFTLIKRHSGQVYSNGLEPTE